MLSVRLTPALEKRLERLSKRTGRTKSHYVKRALAQFLDLQEDYIIAGSRLQGDFQSIPLKDVVLRLGLGRQV